MDAKQHRNRIHTAANRASSAMSLRHANCYADMPEGKEFAKAMAEALIDGMPPEQALEFTHNAVGGNSEVVDRLMTELEPLMKAHVEAHSLSLPNGRIVHAESYEAKRHEAMGHTQRALSATQDALTEPSAPEKHDEAARAHEKARDAHHEAKEKAPAPEARDHEELGAKHEEMCRYHEARAKGDVAKAEITPDQEVMKAQVKEHERHLKSGKIVRVGAHDRRSPASQKAHEASRKAHEFSTKAESKADHLRAVTHHGTAQGLHQTAAIKTDHPEEREAHMAHAAEHYDMQRGHASMAMAGGGKDKHLEERAEKNLKQHFHHEETDSDGDHDGDKPIDEGKATDGTKATEPEQTKPGIDEKGYEETSVHDSGAGVKRVGFGPKGGISGSAILHPEHQEAIRKLEHGQSHHFEDEQGSKWHAYRHNDEIHLREKGSSGLKGKIKHSAIQEHKPDPKPFDAQEYERAKELETKHSLANESSRTAERAGKEAHDRVGPFGEHPAVRLANEIKAHAHAREAHKAAMERHQSLATHHGETEKGKEHQAAAHHHRDQAAMHHAMLSDRKRALESATTSASAHADQATRTAKNYQEHIRASEQHEGARLHHAALHASEQIPGWPEERTIHLGNAERHRAIADAHKHFSRSSKTLADAMSEAAHQASSRVHGAHEEDCKRLHGEAAEIHRMAHNFHAHMGNRHAADTHRVMAEHHERESR